mgnify:CR=1 FL=1
MSRYVVAGAVVFGGSLLILLMAVAEMWVDARRNHTPRCVGPRYTVVWREDRFQHCALTGRVEWLDAETLLIDDGADNCVMVARSDVEGMY